MESGISSKSLTALITGASSGIGAAAASELARHGITVILASRRVHQLERTAATIRDRGGKALVIPVDLNDTSAVVSLYQSAVTAAGRIDILVNNAGFGWYGYLAEMPEKEVTSILRVNIEAGVLLTSLVLPEMIRRNYGRIIHIGSIAPDIPSQGTAVYSATKSFWEPFTTAASRELQGTGVTMSVIKPGPVRTEFFSISSQRSGSSRIPAERFAISPEVVARAVWKTIQNPRKRMYVPWYLMMIPSIEWLFGWIMDRIGPILLRNRTITDKSKQPLQD